MDGVIRRVSLLLVLAAGAAHAEPYEVHDLGVAAGDAESQVLGAGAAGIVGYGSVAGGASQPHALLWGDPGAAPLSLGVPAGWLLSVATGIDPAGLVAGYVGNSPSGTRAAYWSGTDHALTLLPLLPGGSTSRATANSALGTLVGYGGATGTIAKAIAWRAPDFAATDLGLPVGFVQSFALAVNQAGEIAGHGFHTASNRVHALFWRDGVWTDLGYPDGAVLGARGRGINAHGDVAGWATFPANLNHAMLWTTSDGAIDLGAASGLARSQAMAVGDDGVAVGFGALAATGELHALAWVDGAATFLPELPGHVASQANTIDAGGAIYGFSRAADGTTRAVRWTAPRPLALSCPADQVAATAPGEDQAAVSWPDPIASGGSGEPTVTCAPDAGASFALGTTPVACAATDDAGASASCGFAIEVRCGGPAASAFAPPMGKNDRKLGATLPLRLQLAGCDGASISSSEALDAWLLANGQAPSCARVHIRDAAGALPYDACWRFTDDGQLAHNLTLDRATFRPGVRYEVTVQVGDAVLAPENRFFVTR